MGIVSSPGITPNRETQTPASPTVPKLQNSILNGPTWIKFSTFSGLKERCNQLQLPTFTFPSVREKIERMASVVREAIKFQDVSSSEAGDLENPTNIPSSVKFRKELGISSISSLVSLVVKEDHSVPMQYYILLKNLDEYRYLPKSNTQDIKRAFFMLKNLRTRASVIKGKSTKHVQAVVNTLLENIKKEYMTLTLKKEIMQQIPADYAEVKIKSFESNVAQGALSEVSFVTYQNGEIGFFKPVTEDPSSLGATEGGRIGIPNEKSSLEAHLAQRNVLSYEVSKLLPGDLVPKTVFASHQGVVGTFQQKAPGSSLVKEERKLVPAYDNNVAMLALHQTGDDADRNVIKTSLKSLEISVSSNLGLTVKDNRVYRDSKLIEAEEFSGLFKNEVITATAEFLSSVDTKIDFSLPSLQKAMAQAHLLDLLTGQVDRNPGNFFYEKRGDEGYRLHLIDNDQSFPYEYADFSFQTMDRFTKHGYVIKKLPRLVDSEMAHTIEKLQEEDLIKLSTKMGQTKKEIQATIGRLRGLKKHIQDIRTGEVIGGRIVTTWDETTYEELKKERDNYTFRSIEDVKGLNNRLEAIKNSLKPVI
ncbi:MAG: hypothetical protein ACOYK6_01530 [Chthoniobacterales bacterium]